jgi:Kyakuja-Dileera-Zisupton transposase
MIDGEILETLWSILNSISPSMRTASLAHRSEVLDDHMNDSNWKKTVSISE